MIDPLFWLGFSLLLVAISLTAVFVALIPAVQEIARAARSIEKLADTLSRELPPTLESIRLTGIQISELTDDVTEGVQSAGQVVKQVDQSLGSAKQQAKKVHTTTRSFFVGVKAAWKSLTRSSYAGGTRRSGERLSTGSRPPLDFPPQSEMPIPYRTDENYRDIPRPRSSNAPHPPSNTASLTGRDAETDWLDRTD